MRRLPLITLTLRSLTVLALLLATLAVGNQPAHADDTPVKLRVEITDQGFNGNPGELDLQVEPGSLVELTFVWAHQGYSREEHIISLEGYKLETEKLNAQHRESTLKFIADKPGTFNFKCDIECELHNYLQRGFLKIGSGGGSAAGAAKRTPTTLAVTPSSKETGSTYVNLMAVLKDSSGAPVSKATITFLEDADFIGTKAKMTLGSAQTDEHGVAFFDYRPTLDQPVHAITAQFDAMGVYAESAQSVQLKQSGAPASGYSTDDNSLAGLREWGPLGLAIAVTGVWLVLGFVLFQAVGIAWQRPTRRSTV